MRIGRLAPLFLLSIVGIASPLQAQAQSPKIAIVSPHRIFKQMAEKKDLDQKIENDFNKSKADLAAKAQTIKDLIGQRGQIKPDHPQYRDLSVKIDQMQAEFEVMQKVAQQQAERSQKIELVHIYREIEEAVAEEATSGKIDLVITDTRRDIPDNVEGVPLATLDQFLSQRNVLFASKPVDITELVLTRLDRKYAAAKK
jgi:Skp family chaperone for outer membrane proteins